MRANPVHHEIATEQQQQAACVVVAAGGLLNEDTLSFLTSNDHQNVGARKRLFVKKNENKFYDPNMSMQSNASSSTSSSTTNNTANSVVGN